MMGLWRLLAALTVAVSMSVIPQTTPADAADVPLLHPGEATYWEGPFVEQAGPGHRDATAPVACEGLTGQLLVCAASEYGTANFGAYPCPVTHCFDYIVDVAEGGRRLRVGLDHPSSRDSFSVTVRQHPFEDHSAFATTGFGAYSGEAVVDRPPAGRYAIRVAAHRVERSDFRLRAILDASPDPAPVRDLMPNLRMTPPFEFAFAGCQASELVTYTPAPRRCLRLSVGPENVGAGPLDLQIHDAGQLNGTMWQRIWSSNGSYREVPAGEFVWHVEHAHYHQVAMSGLELLRVIDEETGDLVPVAPSPKVGFCLRDGRIVDWSGLDSAPQLSAGGSCSGLSVDGPVGTSMGLSPGWADTYQWFFEGNFVDVGTNGDGLYLARATSDAPNSITESSEDDNTGYAFFRVVGETITVIERGYGSSPWDPQKTVASDTRRPTP